MWNRNAVCFQVMYLWTMVPHLMCRSCTAPKESRRGCSVKYLIMSSRLVCTLPADLFSVTFPSRAVSLTTRGKEGEVVEARNGGKLHEGELEFGTVEMALALV